MIRAGSESKLPDALVTPELVLDKQTDTVLSVVGDCHTHLLIGSILI